MAGRRAPAPHPAQSDVTATQPARRIPALINSASGNADAAREALVANDSFDVREVAPGALREALDEVVAEGPKRVLVAGGDGTIATAAHVLLPTNVELAILPGGTLNHFAKDLGISTVPADALTTAVGNSSRGVDIGMVNGAVFLNTSSVGAYVRFVRVRELLEPQFGYRIASALAALRILFELRLMTVELEVAGHRLVVRSPLVFIGVGERELQLPRLGQRMPNGRRGLHVIAVRGRSRARLFALALSAVARGMKSAARSPTLETFIVDSCTISRRRASLIALDGEIVMADAVLEYSLRRDALKVVCP